MNTFKTYFFLFVISLGLITTGCVDNDFDEPVKTFSIDDKNVKPISDVLALFEGTPILLDDDVLGGEAIYIKASVTADDASGNLFKIVVFEDESGALSIIPDRNELNAEFPTGKVIYVKLNGLTLASNNGLPQLGYGLDGTFLQRIPDILVNDFLFASSETKEITPLPLTLAEFLAASDTYLNKLVTFSNVEFSGIFVGKPYAISNSASGVTPESVNATINDCDNFSVIVRNSGFSNFVDDLVPMGNGTITGIIGKFGTDLQLFIRDLNDVDLTGSRCIDDISAESIIDISTLVSMSNDNFIILNEDALGVSPAYIKATVIADDRSGTFFKSLIVEDATGGINLALDADDMFESFPIGAEILVSISGLTLNRAAGLPSIGDGIDSDNRLERVAESKVGSIIINTGNVNEVVSIPLTLNQFYQNEIDYLNRLVEFSDIEFPLGDVGVPFAADATRNITISDCDGDDIIFRASSFADFANQPIPNGSGTFIGIAGKFLDDAQIFLRELSDLTIDSERCDGSGGQATNEITIQSIQDRFYDLGADKAEEGYITGTVISDKNTEQLNFQNIILQNGEDGILVRFSSGHDFEIGTQLQITVSGQEVSEFRGVLQVTNVPLFNAINKGSGTLPAPREITVDEILLDNNTYESTRVLIKGATLSGSSTFSGNVNVDDGTEEIVIFTFDYASYANDPVPSGVVDVTGIVSQFEETVQLLINGSSDISGGTVDPGGDDKVTTGFEDYNDGEAINKDGWMTIATKGNRTWISTSFQDDRFAECEAYQDTNPETEAWLITPSIDTDDKSTFSFQTAQAFWEHQGLTVWISMDFSDFSDANWESLDQAKIANNDDDFFDLVDSGDIDLKDYFGGTVRVGFKYEGTAAANTTKMRLDNVLLK